MRQTGKIIINRLDNRLRTKSQTTLTHKTLTKCQILEFVLIAINRFLIGFVTLYMCWICLRLNYKDIPFHALLCSIGFVCLMSEGLLAHYRANAFTLFCMRSEKTRTHWVLQLTASLIGLLGVGVKICLEEVHFHTLHGLVGLVATLFLILSLLTGVSSMYANELKTFLQPLFNKAFHNIWGILTFTLAMISMYTAIETDIFLEHSPDAQHYMDFRRLIQGCICIIWLLSCYGPLWCLIYTKFCNSY